MINPDKTIRERHSVRKYTDKAIEGETLTHLQEIIKQCNKESGMNIQLVLNDSSAFDNFILHHGRLQNAKNYIALVGNKKAKDLDETAGYYGEKIVLEAQEMGLNTCWVGGTYSKKSVKAEIGDDEKIVAVIAVGYGENQGVPHSSKTFEDVSVTVDGTVWYKKGVEYALLAPTALNQQKFKFQLLDNNIVSVKAEFGAMTKIDKGIAKYHFEIGAGNAKFSFKD